MVEFVDWRDVSIKTWCKRYLATQPRIRDWDKVMKRYFRWYFEDDLDDDTPQGTLERFLWVLIHEDYTEEELRNKRNKTQDPEKWLAWRFLNEIRTYHRAKYDNGK